MNEINYEKIMNCWKSPDNTYAWDFIFSEGESLLEKYGSLYENIRTLVLNKNNLEKPFVVGNRAATSMLEVTVGVGKHKDSKFEPRYNHLINGLDHIGSIERSCGDNGYNTNFELFSHENAPKDEILVVNGEKISIIKLFNYIS
jgi:hypothetical protein